MSKNGTRTHTQHAHTPLSSSFLIYECQTAHPKAEPYGRNLMKANSGARWNHLYIIAQLPQRFQINDALCWFVLTITALCSSETDWKGLQWPNKAWEQKAQQWHTQSWQEWTESLERGQEELKKKNTEKQEEEGLQILVRERGNWKIRAQKQLEKKTWTAHSKI